jgi:DNA-binding transcriptional regulator YiaG
MPPIELKQWQADLGLSEAAMAHYLGIPVNTLKKWINGTRALQAAPLRLIEVLKRVQDDSQRIHLELMREARAAAPDRAPAKRGRPRKGIGATQSENAPQAPESTLPGIPEWLSSAV